MVFRSIVAQLAKSNEKFMYGAVREGGRARDFEEAIEWLVSAGMLNRIYNVSKAEHPLAAFDKLDQFTRENEAFRENPLVSDFLAAELAFCRMMQEIGLYVTDQMHFE